MMQFLRRLLEETKVKVKSSRLMRSFYPLIEATDEFFFGTDKVSLSAPHLRDSNDIKRYMSMVIIALLPTTLASIYFYGLRVILIIAVSYIFGGLTEVIFSISRRKPIYEGFLVTGLIFPLILPPTIPLWMVAVGVVFGVFFGKEVFGGTGRNIFNPALVGRVFLSVAFPQYFTNMWYEPLKGGWAGLVKFQPDTISAATPLINFKTAHNLTDYISLLWGTTPSSIGEAFRIGIIVGGVFLILIKIIDWRIPLSFLGTVFIFTWLGHIFDPQKIAPALFQLLTGGLLFGAFFMATDPVTSPFTFQGRWAYGILLGILTVLIRAYSGFVEGVMFAILLMNALAPLIDSIVVSICFKKIPSNSLR